MIILVKLKGKIEYLYKNNSCNLEYITINLLRRYFIEINNYNYKLKILELINENEKLLEYSLFFIYHSFEGQIQKIEEQEGYNNNYISNFLEIIDSKKGNKLFLFFDKNENEIIKQTMLYYFENIFVDYFSKNKKKMKGKKISEEEILSNLFEKQNLAFLKKCLNHIENYIEMKNHNEDNLNNLGRLISIAYTKIYIQNLSKEYKENKKTFDFDFIIEEISSKNNKARNIIKLYFFKCYHHLFKDNGFTKLVQHINNEEEKFPFNDYYIDITKKGNNGKGENYVLDYNFIPLTNFFEKFWPKYLSFNNELKTEKFKKLKQLITDKFFEDNNGIDILFCLSVNNLLSFYFLKEIEKNEYLELTRNFKHEFALIIEENNNININDSCISLLNKLFDIENFINYIIRYEKNNLKNDFEIIMHSLRFVLQIMVNKNGFYYNLLNQQYKEFIDNNYIIGNLPFWNLHIESYYKLDKEFKYQTQYGHYICTCGYCYQIQNCTNPYVKMNCINCGRPIGGYYNSGRHFLFDKEHGQTNHFRVIFKGEKSKVDIGIQCKTFEEYEKEVNDKYLNIQNKGINKKEMDITKRYDNVRNLNELGFRILNFILYSTLYFGNLLGILIIMI